MSIWTPCRARFEAARKTPRPAGAYSGTGKRELMKRRSDRNGDDPRDAGNRRESASNDPGSRARPSFLYMSTRCALSPFPWGLIAAADTALATNRRG